MERGRNIGLLQWSMHVNKLAMQLCILMPGNSILSRASSEFLLFRYPLCTEVLGLKRLASIIDLTKLEELV